MIGGNKRRGSSRPTKGKEFQNEEQISKGGEEEEVSKSTQEMIDTE